jgi:hypothetical protein
VTRTQLQRKLDALGVPRDQYKLDGLGPGELYCVVREGERWRVVYSERGKITFSRDATSEQAAYVLLFEELAQQYRP